MRIFAIGDIHGCLKAFNTLLQAVPWRPGDLMITLGDYVDRGPDSKGIIDRLLALAYGRQLVTLQGNHEIMMLNARVNPAARDPWLKCGGQETVRSYGGLARVPEEHWEFLETCAPYYETEEHFFVHANAAPDLPLEQQTDAMLFWERFYETKPHSSGKKMVCGHTHQSHGRPADIGHAVCIDTFAYGGGWLTCLEVQSGLYWQANQAGQKRMGSLAKA